METEEYSRKPFKVRAVQVTFENCAEVAEWCGGEVAKTQKDMMGSKMNVPCVRVPLSNKSQTVDAAVGDWVVDRKGFRVFGHQQFTSMFTKVRVAKPVKPTPIMANVEIYSVGVHEEPGADPNTGVIEENTIYVKTIQPDFPGMG